MSDKSNQSPCDNSTTNMNILRRELRRQRRQLSRSQQRQAEIALWQRVTQQPEWRRSKRIGLYLHAFGEIATRQLFLSAHQQHKQVFLPQVCPMNQRLKWVRVSWQQYCQHRFYRHGLGMFEPMQRGIAVQHLDLLCLPLLAADRHGTRLGMGGGFYDRTLHQARQRPFRLGLAHSFQLLDVKLPRQAWDQALHALATPQQVLRFNAGQTHALA